jgi:hypothetical protein
MKLTRECHVLIVYIRTQVHSMTVDIRNLLCLFQSHMSLQQSTPRGLGTSWQQDPVTLEDALGFRIPIPLELVDSWDVSKASVAVKTLDPDGNDRCLTRLL